MLHKNRTEKIIKFRNKSLSETTVSRYKTAVRKFRDFLYQNRLIECPESIWRYLKELERHYAPSTYNLEGQAIKDYLLEKHKADAQACYLIQESFRRFFKRRSTQRSIEEDGYLTHKEIINLAPKLFPRWRLFMLGLYFSGARISELLDVRLSDVVSLDGKVTIKIRHGKMRRERTAYLPLILYNEIRKVFQSKNQIYLLEKKAGGSYNRCYVSTGLSKAAKKHDIRLWPHKLRHSKAMYLKDHRNLSADQIAKALGHKSVKTTLDHYFHGTPSAEDQGILDFNALVD